MEARLCSDAVFVSGELSALCGDDAIEFFDGLDMAVDDGFIDMEPQRFCRLQFGRIRRQVDEFDAFGHVEVWLCMPSGIVQQQQDDAILAGPGLCGEQRQQGFEQRLGDAVGEIPERFAARGCDEGGDVKPVEAMVAKGCRPLSHRRPDPADHRLEAEAMLVGGKQIDLDTGMAQACLFKGFSKLFLNACCSSSLAAFGFFGRGAWIDQPIALSASQPRCVAQDDRP